MNSVIVYKTEEDNGVAILYSSSSWDGTLEELAAKDVPENAEWCIISFEEIPRDNIFRGAWKLESDTIKIDVPKAKTIWRNKFRVVRKPLLAALDVEFMRAVEVGDASLQREIAAKKQALRDVTSIELPDTPEDIKATWPSILGPKPF